MFYYDHCNIFNSSLCNRLMMNVSCFQARPFLHADHAGQITSRRGPHLAEGASGTSFINVTYAQKMAYASSILTKNGRDDKLRHPWQKEELD